MAQFYKSRIIKENTEQYFTGEDGFGEHKTTAIELLQETTNLLNSLKIKHFLISGTLLGYVRHNDFIPWDDDIDLLVENKIFDEVDDLKKDYPHLNFICVDNFTYLKVSFENKGYQIPDKEGWKLDCQTKKLCKNNWPFIDLFVYHDKNTHIEFFKKKWDFNKFFPAKNINFLGINSLIPNDPNYFLEKNYGIDYMTTFINKGFSHKKDKIIRRPKTKE